MKNLNVICQAEPMFLCFAVKRGLRHQHLSVYQEAILIYSRIFSIAQNIPVQKIPRFYPQTFG